MIMRRAPRTVGDSFSLATTLPALMPATSSRLAIIILPIARDKPADTIFRLFRFALGVPNRNVTLLRQSYDTAPIILSTVCACHHISVGP